MENLNISSAQYQRNIKDTDNIAIKTTINGKILADRCARGLLLTLITLTILTSILKILTHTNKY